jgi:hypothetical protein
LAEECSPSSCDGFMPRFIIFCPERSKITLKNLKSLENEKNTLVKLFATIKILHKNPIRCKFSLDAFNYLSDCFEDYDLIVDKNEQKDPFIGYLINDLCYF